MCFDSVHLGIYLIDNSQVSKFLYGLFSSITVDPHLFIARFFGNTSWLIALTYYIYITFLGYSGKFSSLYFSIYECN